MNLRHLLPRALRPLLVGALLLVVLGASVLLAVAAPHARAVQTATGGGTTWYFAEGYTGSTYTEYLTLADFGSTDASVTITYYFDSGAPTTKNYTVPHASRLTLTVNTEAGTNKNVAMKITSTQPIVAERPMYFTYNGTIPGGTDVLGATQLSSTFYFPYLDTSATHDNWLAILNPSSNSMTVTIQYFPASGGAPITVTHTVAATSRGEVFVNSESGLTAGTYYWAQVSLSTPGVVERSLYLKDTSTGYTGGSTIVGLTQAQTSWSFAEGYTSSTYTERYLLVNPSTTNTVVATLTFDKSDGSTAVIQAALAPRELALVNADAVLGTGGVNNGVQVQATGAIFAERLISFTYTGPVGGSNSSSIPGFTEVPGTPTAGTLFSFAEGYTGNGFAEYLSILNPDPSTTASVTVTLAPTSGNQVTNTYQVSPHSRFSLYVNGVLGNQSLAMQVTSNVNVVAERVLYFTYNGSQTGGTAVVGYQL